MPWYKIEANTGPGHQSHFLDYVWRDKRLTKQEKQELFEDALAHSDAIGSINAIKQLPAKVRDQKIALYKRRIEIANKMLTMLIPKSELHTQVKECANVGELD